MTVDLMLRAVCIVSAVMEENFFNLFFFFRKNEIESLVFVPVRVINFLPDSGRLKVQQKR